MLSSNNREPLIIASYNPGKVKEVRHFLEGLAYRPVGLEQLLEVSRCQEIGDNFDTIAVQKALHYSQYSKWLTLADDSGLEVDALGGLPGVHSARFLGESATDEDRYREVLRRLSKIPDSRRTARFICSLALARQGEVLGVFREVLEGSITRVPRGTQGFGYDPIFLVPAMQKTVAELLIEEKEQISHRGLALRKMRDYLLNNLEKGSHT